MLKKIAAAAGLIIIATSVHAQDTTAVSFDSGSVFVYDQNTGATNKLSGGTSADGDGFVLQLGYFGAATTADNFAGSWIPLTGEGSLNTAIVPSSSPTEPYNKTSIGDVTAEGGDNGVFFLVGLNFVSGSATSGNNLPAAGTPLSIRFYNGSTIATSTFYNTVSDDSWLWKAPATPTTSVGLSLDDPGLEWLSIALGGDANTAFHTTLPTAVQEPSTLASMVIGGGGLAFYLLGRRRRL
jgi:hypothetical protein